MNKLNFIFLRFVSAIILCLTIIFCINKPAAYAQLKEPDVRPADNPITPPGAGFHNRIGASAFVNNFGFGVSGIYGHAIGPFTEVTFSAGITGIRDASAQQFLNYFTGRKVVPNKYKRALGFPITIGIEHRIFPYAIADNFRLFISASGGPAFAFTYPYVQDGDGNGYRSTRRVEVAPGQFAEIFVEDINDFFSGWSEGEGHWGLAGDISIGVDLGSNFNSQATFEIGYFFFYFAEGLQIMEPFRNTGYNEDGFSIGQDLFFEPQKFFGSPQIKFTFSSWW